MLMLNVTNQENKGVDLAYSDMTEAMAAIGSLDKAMNVKAYRLEVADGWGIYPVLEM